MSGINWVPLESNPEILNKFLQNLGVPSQWNISDVCSLDDELLSFIPTPALAFLLLFPVSAANIEYRKQKEEEISSSGYKASEKVYFMKQFIKNACGTVALIHAVANNRDVLNMDKDAILEKFIESTVNLSPEEKAYKLESNDSISAAHETSAQEGQTEAPNPNQDVDLHFIAIVNVDGQLYELDGRMDQPISHGPTTADTFVKDAARICRGFMQRDPETLSFTVLSLGPSQ